MQAPTEGLSWKLRRIAARLRQRDVAGLIGMSTTRYSAIERGDATPTDLDRKLIERHLRQLPVFCVPGPETDRKPPSEVTAR